MTAPNKPRARAEIHERVHQILRERRLQTGDALDVPLGPGVMAESLKAMGFRVSGVDMDIAQSSHVDPAITRLEANLNAPIPLPDRSFDLITCLEGIEHVENHSLVLREFARLLRPGGTLIISTPNVCNIEDRLNYVVRGSLYRFISKEEYDKFGNGYDHQNLITAVELRQVIEWAGLKLVQAYTDVTKWKQLVFLSPFWLFVRLYTALQSPKRKRKYALDLANSDQVLLGGNTIIFLATKA